MKLFLSVWALLLAGVQFSAAQIKTYPSPQGSILNETFTLQVRQRSGPWKNVPIYSADVANLVGTRTVMEKTSFAYFDFKGEVEVSVTSNRGVIRSSRIRPLSYGVGARSDDNKVLFSMQKPLNLSVEVNGDIFHNLQIFANELEDKVPSAKDRQVIFYGPGIHNVGTVDIPSNTTVYIAGGAIVRGQLLIKQAENIRIKGRGILTQLGPELQSPVNPTKENGRTLTGRNDELTIINSKNVEISDIIVLPHKYSVIVGESKAVKITGLRSISSEGNADGIDIFCSSDVKIDRVFMRNSDDCIAIYGHRWAFYGNVKDVEVTNSILWADVAHPILIGTHGDSQHPDTISRVRFFNLNILDQHENQFDYQGAMAINAGDSNFIKDIRFEKIFVEDIRKGQLVNLRVMFNKKYNTSPGAGIEDVLFKDVRYDGWRDDISIIAGYDPVRVIKNITFENLTRNGLLITDTMPEKPSYYKTGDMARIFVGEHVENLKFITTDTAVN